MTIGEVFLTFKRHFSQSSFFLVLEKCAHDRILLIFSTALFSSIEFQKSGGVLKVC
jgi:hypothetical protein